MRVIKLFSAALICLGCWSGVLGQEETNYTHYIVNPVLINPAAVGFSGDHELSLNFRNRWAAFPGSPNAYTLTYQGAADRLGYGIQLWQEEIGDYTNQKIGIKGSYKVVGGPTTLQVGLSADYHRSSIGSEVLSNPLIDPSDELLLRAEEGLSFFDVGVAIFGQIDDQFTFGGYLPNLIYTRIDDVNLALPEDDEDTFSSYFIFMAYKIDAINQGFAVEPSIAFKKERFVPFHTDFNVKLSFLEDQLFGGLTYSVGAGDRVGLLIGTQFSGFQVAYSYDVSLQDLQDYSNGAHELTVGYRFRSNNQPNNSELPSVDESSTMK